MSFLFKQANEYLGQANLVNSSNIYSNFRCGKRKDSQHTALIEWEGLEFTELKFCKDIGLRFTALVTSYV